MSRCEQGGPAAIPLGGKENAASQPSQQQQQGAGVALCDIRKPASCNLCHGLIASSLVLSCGHQYCGSCLFDWLGTKPSCPNCQASNVA